MKLRSCVTGLLVALCFALSMSAGHALSAMRGDLSLALMDNHGVDELYYFALMRDAAHGYPNLGHAAFKEHRLDATVTTFAPAVEGLAMRASGWSTETAALLGDLLFPFLGALLLFLALRGLLRKDGLAAAGTLGIMAVIGTYWLRSSNPQIPFVLVCAYLACLCSPDRQRPWLCTARGLCIALLLYTQLLYGSLLVIVEGVDALYRLTMDRKAWKRWLTAEIVTGVTLVIGAVPKMLLSLQARGDPAITDTFHRLGVIPSRYPAAPFLQLVLVSLGIVLLQMRRRAPACKREIDTVLVLLLSGLIGLNQSLVHGIDATFSSYYANVLVFIVGMAFSLLLVATAPSDRLRSAAAWLLSGALVVSFAVAVYGENTQDIARAAAYRASPEAGLMAWLGAQPGELVIAAPRGVSDLVPAYTDHFVLLNTYSFNQRSADRELAERYLLQTALFPDGNTDPTYQQVFGGYAGMLGARLRTACRIKRFLHLSTSCAVDVPALIPHQDLRKMLDAKQADLPALLRQYHVDLIIAPAENAVAKRLCPKQERQGMYWVYRCT
jgi:hypothetical protein